MQLSNIEIDNQSKLNIPDNMRATDKLFIKDGILYKLFSDNSFTSEKKRNIDFLMNSNVPNTPQIYKKIYKGNELCGYSMEYINDALTFRQAINKDIPLEEKVNAIIDVYDTLKYLHTNSIHLGDIHSDNMLITKEKGYLIDLEEMRFPGDEWKFKQYYLVRPNSNSNRINNPNDYTDNVKLMVCSLSLLLGRDLESFVDQKRHEINIERVYRELILQLNNEEYIQYFEELMTGTFTEYFGDFIKRIYKGEKHEYK